MFARAAELSHAVIEPDYPKVMQLDQELEQSYALIPMVLRVRPTTQSIIDDPGLIMSRFNIELLYQKTRSVLHRRYMTRDDSVANATYSRTSCVDAAMKTLLHHADIYKSTLPGGSA